jgi:hypothetical protein
MVQRLKLKAFYFLDINLKQVSLLDDIWVNEPYHKKGVFNEAWDKYKLFSFLYFSLFKAFRLVFVDVIASNLEPKPPIMRKVSQIYPHNSKITPNLKAIGVPCFPVLRYKLLTNIWHVKLLSFLHFC